MGYVTVTLMTFDRQSNARRTAVESKSNRSCNHRISRKPILWLQQQGALSENDCALCLSVCLSVSLSQMYILWFLLLCNVGGLWDGISPANKENKADRYTVCITQSVLSSVGIYKCGGWSLLLFSSTFCFLAYACPCNTLRTSLRFVTFWTSTEL